MHRAHQRAAPSCPLNRTSEINPLPDGSVFGSHIPNVLHAVRERRGKRVAAVDELERRDLPVGEAGGCRRIGRIGIDVVRTPLRGPGLAASGALLHVEDGAARHVVVDDPVGEAVEAVALPHELAADGIHLGARHPVGERLLLTPDQPGREHQRREVDDGHVGDDAVVVVWIALGDGQRFAAALRRADVVVDRGLPAIRRSTSTIAASCVFFICM